MSLTIRREEQFAHTLRVTAEGSWTWDHLTRLFESLAETAEEFERGADVIVDLSESVHVPVGFKDAIERLGSLNGRLAASTNRLIFVGAIGVQRVALEQFRRMAPGKLAEFQLVDTVQQAFEALKASSGPPEPERQDTPVL